jgi:hypothetical protein
MIPGWAKNAFSPSTVALEFNSLSQEGVAQQQGSHPRRTLDDVFHPVIAPVRCSAERSLRKNSLWILATPARVEDSVAKRSEFRTGRLTLP